MDQKKIDDTGVENLKPLAKSLKSLGLSGLRITDTAVRELSRYKCLETLDISKCMSITVVGLKILGNFPMLSQVDIIGSKIVKNQRSQIEKRSPNITFVWS